MRNKKVSRARGLCGAKDSVNIGNRAMDGEIFD